MRDVRNDRRRAMRDTQRHTLRAGRGNQRCCALVREAEFHEDGARVVFSEIK